MGKETVEICSQIFGRKKDWLYRKPREKERKTMLCADSTHEKLIVVRMCVCVFFHVSRHISSRRASFPKAFDANANTK